MKERIASLGAIYILYEIGIPFFCYFFNAIGTETLANSDTLIEFISRTIFHLKQQVSLILLMCKTYLIDSSLYVLSSKVTLSSENRNVRLSVIICFV